MKLYIKHMVSLRCKMLVKDELKKLGLNRIVVELGSVDIQDDFTLEQLDIFRQKLQKAGLELLDDRKDILVEKIKKAIVEMIYHYDEFPNVNDSDYLSSKLNHNYTYLSNKFTEVKNITIQQYIIMHKIEKVKELLLYDELTLTEIAYRLRYSSVAHLSNQFKKLTGLTPTYFKKLRRKNSSKLCDNGTP